ncbi:MAG: hypothetical protein Q7S22_08870 [Candidatus Micrarchaeota archaeon]|nr:hypothetical protein [Candidatus Micrarchaeota archaeon]
MLVTLKPPVRAKKELICRGDEAVVRRIKDGEYAGMVERLQRVGKETGLQLFWINRNIESNSQIPSYSLLKFLAGSLVHTLFPENFVNLQELRFFTYHGGKRRSYIYSEFVPDEDRVVVRRQANMEMFYTLSLRDGIIFRDETDERERKLNPSLGELSDQMLQSGIIVSHPEANYHFANNQIVFFEVSGLDLQKILVIVESSHARLEALAKISVILASMFKYISFLIVAREMYNARSFRNVNITELSNIVYKNILAGKLNPNEPINELVKAGFHHYRDLSYLRSETIQFPLDDRAFDAILSLPAHKVVF